MTRAEFSAFSGAALHRGVDDTTTEFNDGESVIDFLAGADITGFQD